MNRLQITGGILAVVGTTGLLLQTIEIGVASPVSTFGFLMIPVAFLFFLGYHACAYLNYG